MLHFKDCEKIYKLLKVLLYNSLYHNILRTYPFISCIQLAIFTYFQCFVMCDTSVITYIFYTHIYICVYVTHRYIYITYTHTSVSNLSLCTSTYPNMYGESHGNEYNLCYKNLPLCCFSIVNNRYPLLVCLLKFYLKYNEETWKIYKILHK